MTTKPRHLIPLLALTVLVGCEEATLVGPEAQAAFAEVKAEVARQDQAGKGRIRLGHRLQPPPLIFVDGVKWSAEDPRLDDLLPSDIAAIAVYKRRRAVELYGPEAKGGVVIITTKTAAIREGSSSP